MGRLPKDILLKVGDLQVSVIVEEENEGFSDFRMQRRSCRLCEADDKDIYFKISNFENLSTAFRSGLRDMGPLKSSRWLTH